MKLPFWATIFTITGVIILCALGSWQVKRLVWKTNLVERIKAEVTIDSSAVAIAPEDDLSEILLKRGFLKGEFLHDKTILIQARTYKSHPGYHIITPFKMADYNDKVMFVNRGWIPVELTFEDDIVIKPRGLIMITGALRPAPEYNRFVPQNSPSEDQWYRISPQEIAEAYDIKDFYSKNIFYKELRNIKRGIPDMPVPAAIEVSINNNHAGYALFWFAMAITLAVIYGLRFIAPQFRKKF